MARSLDDLRYPVAAGTCAKSWWSGGRDRCRWCDQPARPGSVWCGHRCEDDYRRNHWWDQARDAAVARDGGRCCRCGRSPQTATLGKLLLRALLPLGPVEAAELWASAEWQRFRRDCELEVHHLVPREGAGYQSGCHHHLDELQTLCHGCHATETAHAQQARRFQRRAG